MNTQLGEERNLTMLTDLYQLTMMYGYYKCGCENQEVVFDLFFREIGSRSYCVMAGTESVMDIVNNLRFDKSDVEYLRSLNMFDDGFLKLLSELRFTGEIYGMKEGTLVFPREPLIRVKAPILQAQLLETALLNVVNHQTLIATKASRVQEAAGDDLVMEFGLRRAQGPDAGVYGARAAVIGGCGATSNILAGKLFGIPVAGTHAHSFVMSFPDEVSAFRAYAQTFPSACLLLVDTYDTIKSGIPNAIQVFKELRSSGFEPMGIRLDSGDITYISKKAREMLDEAGFPNAKICASSDLDEFVIRELKMQGAAVNSWGVGTRLITSSDVPALGGVYKMSAENVDGVLVPKIKLSENPIKVTYPGYKKVVRLYRKRNGMAIADLIAMNDEVIDETKPLRLYHPEYRYKSMLVDDFYSRDLLVPLFVNGKQVYSEPSLDEICEYARAEKSTFWGEYRRLMNPDIFKVDMSDKLYSLKEHLIAEIRGE
ncbi:MAG: nicotinate phosphoribosyltransferase [Clostridia bacterium]